MAFVESVAQRNAKLTAIATGYNTGFIRFYTGTRPATPATGLSGNTLLVSLTFSATAFGAAAAGAITANAIGSGTAVATGTVTFARFFASDGTTVLADCDVATSASDINVNTTSIVTAGNVSISSLTISQA